MGVWSYVRLGDVSSVNYGYTEKASFGGDGPKFLRITDIQNGNVDWSCVPNCPISPEDFLRFRVLDGDIVFARTGATTGKSYLISNPPDAVAASYLIRLRLSHRDILPSFVCYYFQSADYWAAVSSGTTGSAQGGFNASKLSDLRIPAPPLEEQKRIVAILDEAFEGLDRAAANAKKNLANARELFDSHLQLAFSNRSAEWKQYTLDQICSFSSGGTPSKGNASYWSGRIPWVSGKDMKSDRISDAALHISQAAIEHSATRIAPRGSLLILVRGMGLANGIAVAEVVSPSAFNQDIKAIHPNPGISPRFLLHSLRASFARSEKLLSNAAHGTLKIEMEDLRRVPLRVPPLQVQEDIVSQTDSLAAQTQNLTRLYQQKVRGLEDLKRSLLQKAFAGELTSRMDLAA